MSKNVLTEFKLNEEEENFLSITCRPAGLLSWLLSKLGIVSTCSLKANSECLDFSGGALTGFDTTSVPLTKVSAIVYGLQKPIKMLVLAILSLIASGYILTNGGSGWLSLVFVILAAYFGWKYYTGKNFYIGFMNGGDKLRAVFFHPSVIEGIKVDDEKVKEVCTVLRRTVLKSQQK